MNSVPDPGFGAFLTPGSGMEKIRIRDKHPGFATLVMKAKDYVVSSCSDMKSLLKNKSFVLSTIAFTCVTYCAGAMMWWGPNFAFAGAPAFTFCGWTDV
jgi:hypothetical protein